MGGTTNTNDAESLLTEAKSTHGRWVILSTAKWRMFGGSARPAVAIHDERRNKGLNVEVPASGLQFERD